jgi:WD40 repeat protein
MFGHDLTVACTAGGTRIAVANRSPTFRGGNVEEGWEPLVDILDAVTGDTIASPTLATKEELTALSMAERVSHFEVTALAFSPDGKTLAVGTSIGQVKLFNAETGEFIRSFDDEAARLADRESPKSWQSLARALGCVNDIAFSPDGKLLAVGGESFADFSNRGRLGQKISGPGRLKIFNVATGALRNDLAGHSHFFTVAFSPDGTLLASCGRWFSEFNNHGNGAILWDMRTGQAISHIPTNDNGAVPAVAFSPDSQWIAVGSQSSYDRDGFKDASSGAVCVTNVETGITQWRQTVPERASGLAFSQDGKTVITLCGRQSVRFLDMAAGAFRHEIKSQESPPLRWSDFALAQKAGTLVIGSIDDELRGHVTMWDVGK